MTKPRISIIVACSKNLGIGKNNGLLWHIPEDLKRFKELTLGHPVIMGMRTWKSLPEKARPLPNRSNIVISDEVNFEAPGAIVCSSLPDAIKKASEINNEEIFIIGGARVYKDSIDLADRLYLTLIDSEAEADVFFPDYSEFTKKISEENGRSKTLKYSFLVLER